MKNVWIALSFASMTLAGTLFGCQPAESKSEPSRSPSRPASGQGEKVSIAFVTNNASDFWNIAKKGTDKAQAELPNVTVEFKMPQDGTAAAQKQILDDLVTSGVKAIAVSPVDPASQTEHLNSIAEKVKLFCQDSDAAESKRLCYVGTDNVAAGRMAGEAIKKALPNGGKIMLFVGMADAQNAKERKQGIEEALKGSKVTILGLKTDDTDRVRAKQNVADAISANPDLAGLVGLWSYNGPAIAGAVKEAGKAGKIQIVCFDEEDDTLTGIADGTIAATVVQQPFEFGYQSVKMLEKVVSGASDVIPADKKSIIPTRIITKAEVEEFKKKLAELRG